MAIFPKTLILKLIKQNWLQIINEQVFLDDIGASIIAIQLIFSYFVSKFYVIFQTAGDGTAAGATVV